MPPGRRPWEVTSSARLVRSPLHGNERSHGGASTALLAVLVRTRSMHCGGLPEDLPGLELLSKFRADPRLGCHRLDHSHAGHW